MTPTETLRHLAAHLLDPNTPASDIRAAVHALTDLFASLEGFAATPTRTALKDGQETYTAHGKAISLTNAARCAWEFLRTARFLQGVHAAIREAQRRFPGQCIEVLYAGTGPYATLALPLMPLFTPDEVRFTLLDIHSHCLDSVATLVTGFGFEDFVREYVTADACHYRYPDSRPLHVVVSETMQLALAKEPQVAITLNLAPQLTPGGLLVPEQIHVRACLTDGSREIPTLNAEGHYAERLRLDLGPLFELSLDSVRPWAGINPTEVAFPPTQVVIPDTRPTTVNRFLLLTHITTFGDITLDDYACSLTCPLPIRELDYPAPGQTLEFRYQMDATPGFIHHRSDSPQAPRKGIG